MIKKIPTPQQSTEADIKLKVQTKPRYLLKEVDQATKVSQRQGNWVFKSKEEVLQSLRDPIFPRNTEQNIFLTQEQTPQEQTRKIQKFQSYQICGGMDSFLKETAHRQEQLAQQNEKTLKQLKKQVTIRPQTAVLQTKVSLLSLSQDQQDQSQVLMNTQQVQQEIEQAKKNVKTSQSKNQIINTQLMSYLSNGDQLYAKKQEKIMQQFQNQQQRWEHRVLAMSKKIKRNPKHSLFDNSDQFRVKEEQKQLIENIQTEQEKHGNQIWYRYLRQPPSSIEDENPYEFIHKLEANQKAFVDRRCKIIEVVRKPQSATIRPTLQLQESTYLTKRLLDKKKIVDKLINCDPKDITQIEVIGSNVLKNEISGVMQLLSSRKTTSTSNNYRKFITDEDPHQNAEEIIEVNWNKKELRRRGELVVSKMNFKY